MSRTVKLRKGLDIKLIGGAKKERSELALTKTVSVKPSDFHGLTPKMVVKEGESVKAGTIIFHDKYNEPIKYASPVSGTVKALVRGAKRRILEVLIDTDGAQTYEDCNVSRVADLSAEQVKETLLGSGLWPFIKQRPIDVVADPANAPKAIFVSSFDSSPMAPDYNFILDDRKEEFQEGLNALAKLTQGKVHLGIDSHHYPSATFSEAEGVEKTTYKGPHPVGNVGTQIHHTDPINKGEFVWTVNAQAVALIGRYFMTGCFDLRKTIAFCGSEIRNPRYIDTIVGVNVSELISESLKRENSRVISGNVLTGENIGKDGYLGFYHDQITVIPEGDHLKFAPKDGWMVPLGLNKLTNSQLFASFLFVDKKYRVDTNTNGEERAFVVTGELERVFPFDIYPMQLAKAAITDDIDAMENLGIYEVAPEDFALCEFVCTSKIDIQDKIRTGLDLIASECM